MKKESFKNADFSKLTKIMVNLSQSFQKGSAEKTTSANDQDLILTDHTRSTRRKIDLRSMNQLNWS